jgi:hypothetical protein
LAHESRRRRADRGASFAESAKVEKRFASFIRENDPASGIDDARVARNIAEVFERIAGETPRGRTERSGAPGRRSGPAIDWSFGVRLASLMFAAAMVGGLFGFYSATEIDVQPQNGLVALLSVSVEHPLGWQQ